MSVLIHEILLAVPLLLFSTKSDEDDVILGYASLAVS